MGTTTGTPLETVVVVTVKGLPMIGITGGMPLEAVVVLPTKGALRKMKLDTPPRAPVSTGLSVGCGVTSGPGSCVAVIGGRTDAGIWLNTPPAPASGMALTTPPAPGAGKMPRGGSGAAGDDGGGGAGGPVSDGDGGPELVGGVGAGVPGGAEAAGGAGAGAPTAGSFGRVMQLTTPP